MAKNKTSKFGVADDLQYREQTTEQAQEKQETTLEETLQILEQTKKILDSVPPEIAEQLTRKKPKREGSYRFSLYMDADLGEYVNYIKFKRKKSITDYFNELVRADMENDAEWKKENE